KMNKQIIRKITAEEIIQMIEKLSTNKSLGYDGLSYEFYKETVEIVAMVLEK
ncbi:44559_t:CDS:1, partial [Gigaspora margarita]